MVSKNLTVSVQFRCTAHYPMDIGGPGVYTEQNQYFQTDSVCFEPEWNETPRSKMTDIESWPNNSFRIRNSTKWRPNTFKWTVCVSGERRRGRPRIVRKDGHALQFDFIPSLLNSTSNIPWPQPASLCVCACSPNTTRWPIIDERDRTRLIADDCLFKQLDARLSNLLHFVLFELRSRISFSLD